jgi:hypothetical protein
MEFLFITYQEVDTDFKSSLSVSGRYSSGQRGQTVNLLCKLRRFESCSPHKRGKEVKKATLSIFSKPETLKKPVNRKIHRFFVLKYFTVAGRD